MFFLFVDDLCQYEMVGEKREARELRQMERKSSGSGTAQVFKARPVANVICDKAALFPDVNRHAATVTAHLVFQGDYFCFLHVFTS